MSQVKIYYVRHIIHSGCINVKRVILNYACSSYIILLLLQFALYRMRKEKMDFHQVNLNTEAITQKYYANILLLTL